MIFEHAHVTVAVDRRSDFERAFAGVKKHLVAANGGKTAELVRSVDTDGLYLMRVGWDSVEQHAEFGASSEAQIIVDALAEFFVATPQVTHFEQPGIATRVRNFLQVVAAGIASRVRARQGSKTPA
ncbi:antibiotic biosynthesis monooxygenase family protein [Rhodococcus sp. MSC1_016]|jgi:heme-degrading monooxygenase HmoA|uniref:antibiotic biosynthesis monooxygenase family protein n=1 Tax=Rhodococcus sp. MSC1_016 TaxID=2909266 RepID=UPI00202F193F|nr:antibiotic biosynthesis monooxygenase [Rhodococcus sp. MSC1_016]